MYIPKQFKEDDLERMLTLMDEHPFATLVTAPESIPYASHLPLMVERGDRLKLVGHLAKANEQWRHFESCAQTLVIFHGPHAYVSPSCYETAGVPTWNYAAIHLHGKPRLIMDERRLRESVEMLTLKFEKNRQTPWAPLYSPRLLDAIVGFEMEVERMEGKYKLGQNRSLADRDNVIHFLSATGSDASRGVAKLMREHRETVITTAPNQQDHSDRDQ